MNENHFLNTENHNACHSVTDRGALILTFSYFNMTKGKAVPEM
jgi:hypothetical protein